MRNLITIADFAARIGRGEKIVAGDRLWRASTIAPEPGNGRVVRYTFSDQSIGRDGNTIAADGWVLDPFMANPVFLWAHCPDELPIGRVVDIETIGQTLKGNVEYAEHPFADTVYQMVKAGFLNATSVGFIPLKWSFPTDKSRQGGVDFTRVELLEISQVPVPALPTALVDARAAGIDTGPIVHWAERILDGGDAILIPRAELEALRRAAKMPKQAKSKTPAVRASITKIERGLYSVAELAYLLLQLGWLEDDVEWEAEYEGDGSDIPARLTDALRLLGQILVDMTAEEVAELVGEETDQGEAIGEIDAVEMAKITPKQRALILVGRLARSATKPGKVTVELDVVPNAATRGILDALARAGRVLSSENETALRQAADLINGVIGQVAASEDDPAAEVITLATEEIEARAIRERKANALRQKLTVAPAA